MTVSTYTTVMTIHYDSVYIHDCNANNYDSDLPTNMADVYILAQGRDVTCRSSICCLTTMQNL